jgi:hypothetical protein
MARLPSQRTTIITLLVTALAILPGLTVAAQNCPIPLRVYLRFLNRTAATITRKSSNRYQVDWDLTVPLPEGVTRIHSFDVRVQDFLGSGSNTAGGTARSIEVDVPQTRTTPLTTAGIPFATVAGIAECERTLTFTQGRSSLSNSPLCPVPLSLSSPPRVLSVFRTGPNGIRLPDGFGVRVDWTVNGGSSACAALSRFDIQVRVKQATGFLGSSSATASASERTKTVKVTDSILGGNGPEIVEVRVIAVSEVKLSGRSD